MSSIVGKIALKNKLKRPKTSFPGVGLLRKVKKASSWEGDKSPIYIMEAL